MYIVILIFIIYFQKGISHLLSVVSHTVFKPIVVLGNNIGSNISNIGFYFNSKKNLSLENQKLNDELLENKATLANYNSLVDENTKLKESLVRKDEKSELVLGGILSKPNKSLYDTLIIDIGTNNGIKTGDLVLAFGDVPLGRIGEVYPNSSKVTLFSSSGEKTEVVVTGSDVFLEVIGRGGGNFELNVPRDFKLEDYGEVVLPGITPYTVAKIIKVISDPRDSFVKALLTSPVNIQELKFVEVKK